MGPLRDPKTFGLVKDDQAAEHSLQHLKAIIEGSQDAILTKNLDGIITSWNPGATHLFGYSATEAIGRSVTMLIPPDRQDEEPHILSKIRQGERIEHYETIRQRKDGRQVHISLTVSPLHEPDGRIYGASKIARDITRQKLAQEQQRLVLAEMQHRIKNIFSLTGGLIRLCARAAETPEELAQMTEEKLLALARAHALAIPSADADGPQKPTSSLHELLSALGAPFATAESGRIRLNGPALSVPVDSVTPLALVFGELMTNASKYGALRDENGVLDISWEQGDGGLRIVWAERFDWPDNCEPMRDKRDGGGFGRQLNQMTVEGQLDGTIHYAHSPKGLTVTLTLGAL